MPLPAKERGDASYQHFRRTPPAGAHAEIAASVIFRRSNGKKNRGG
jgi:hypothetical protein